MTKAQEYNAPLPETDAELRALADRVEADFAERRRKLVLEHALAARLRSGIIPPPPVPANRGKVTAAAERDVQSARNILESGIELSEQAREALELRVQYPTDSFAQLAARIEVSKDTYQHRLRRALRKGT